MLYIYIRKKREDGKEKERSDNYHPCLVKSESWTHGRLNNQGTNVLPLLLQQRDQEVNSHQDLVDQDILSHLNVTDGNSQTQDLLQLELDSRSDIVDLTSEIIVVGNWSRELTSLRQLWTQKSWNLLNQNLRGNESVVSLRQLLNQLLVLVELLQVVNRHSIDTKGLSSVDIESITEDTDRHVWSWASWQLQSTGETLVSLWVVVLKTDLQLDCLQEVSLLGLSGVLEDLSDVLSDLGSADLGHLFFAVIVIGATMSSKRKGEGSM